MGSTYLGEVRMWGGARAPPGWLLCDGQLLSIAQYPALFDLIRTRFGGDGLTTFALPDMQGRTPVGMGQLSGGSNYVLDSTGGLEAVALSAAELPRHIHPMAAASQGSADGPSGSLLSTAVGGPASTVLYGTDQPLTTLSPDSTTSAGEDLPHDNMQPFLVIGFIIAWQGEVPVKP